MSVTQLHKNSKIKFNVEMLSALLTGIVHPAELYMDSKNMLIKAFRKYRDVRKCPRPSKLRVRSSNPEVNK